MAVERTLRINYVILSKYTTDITCDHPININRQYVHEVTLTHESRTRHQ